MKDEAHTLAYEKSELERKEKQRRRYEDSRRTNNSKRNTREPESVSSNEPEPTEEDEYEKQRRAEKTKYKHEDTLKKLNRIFEKEPDYIDPRVYKKWCSLGEFPLEEMIKIGKVELKLVDRWFDTLEPFDHSGRYST